ncbi:FAS-associated factor 2-B [Triticum urartu]|uniref:FAS-associated factor 2-B n=1 Tax=Triticum urartu TaxID=4572 RepID=M8A1C8_TRIUA|nr:FAS-associated factor 2-B [Triticum urartu]
MAASLQPGSFPFCAVVAPVSSESITVLQRVEGPVTPSELVEMLQRTIDEQRVAFRASMADDHAAAFRASRAEEEERRRSALRLRQEQDAAYLESLRKDQEKERSKRTLQEGTARPKPKPSTKYPGQAGRETSRTTQIRAPAHKETVPSHTTEANTKTSQPNLTSKTRGPKQDACRVWGNHESDALLNQDACRVMIRFPNGERRQQSFRHTDTIREIYKYANSLGIPGIGKYQLVRSYPRKTYGHQQLEMNLGDAGCMLPQTVAILTTFTEIGRETLPLKTYHILAITPHGSGSHSTGADCGIVWSAPLPRHQG